MNEAIGSMSVADESRRVVIALGGNAIQWPGQRGTFEEQLFNIDVAAGHIAQLIAKGLEVVITHGNGPQVGNRLIQNELGRSAVAPMPMDVCGAETQGQIGYLFQQCLENRLGRLGQELLVATILTETEVDADDPAFAAPAKPVGPFYDAEHAEALATEQGFVLREDAGRGWRRVVPSPEPKRLVQAEVIKLLIPAGVVVICSGGGGVPVVREKTGNYPGNYHGVEAVIDKDLAAAVLAADVGAATLLILTDVPKVYLRYGTQKQTGLGRVSAAEMQTHLDAGHFGAGSMGPKVEACLRFVRTGRQAIISSIAEAEEALAGNAGTCVVGHGSAAAPGPSTTRPAMSRSPIRESECALPRAIQEES